MKRKEFLKLKSIKSFLMIGFVIIILFLLSRCPKYDTEEIKRFKLYKQEFQEITEYICENCDSDERKIVSVCFENSRIVSLYYDGNYAQLSDEMILFFNKIKNIYTGDFSHIEVTPKRISYGGLGNRMYVYSRNGKVPDYFYHKGDGMNEDCFYLGDNWYLLMYYHR